MDLNKHRGIGSPHFKTLFGRLVINNRRLIIHFLPRLKVLLLQWFLYMLMTYFSHEMIYMKWNALKNFLLSTSASKILEPSNTFWALNSHAPNKALLCHKEVCIRYPSRFWTFGCMSRQLPNGAKFKTLSNWWNFVQWSNKVQKTGRQIDLFNSNKTRYCLFSAHIKPIHAGA